MSQSRRKQVRDATPNIATVMDLAEESTAGINAVRQVLPPGFIRDRIRGWEEARRRSHEAYQRAEGDETLSGWSDLLSEERCHAEMVLLRSILLHCTGDYWAASHGELNRYAPCGVVAGGRLYLAVPDHDDDDDDRPYDGKRADWKSSTWVRHLLTLDLAGIKPLSRDDDEAAAVAAELSAALDHLAALHRDDVDDRWKEACEAIDRLNDRLYDALQSSGREGVVVADRLFVLAVGDVSMGLPHYPSSVCVLSRAKVDGLGLPA
jgi:hypothetical protein